MITNGTNGDGGGNPLSGRCLGQALIRFLKDAAFLINERGHLVLANEHGTLLLRSLVYRGSSGELRFSNPRIDKVFLGLRQRLFAARQQRLRRRLDTLMLTLSRFPDGEGRDVPGYAILVANQGTEPLCPSAEQIAEMLDLPPMQAKVAHWLLSGGKQTEDTPEGMGERMLKHHINELFQKFGCNSQVELVRRLSALLRTAL
jgi:DNA-binding CsgD family transcriptional regulator